jgi:signal transduction histidine kinase
METETPNPSAERLRKLERVLELSSAWCCSLDLEPFLHTLIAAASELTGCEAASILEPDEEAGQLRFLALPWFHRETLKCVKVPVKGSLAGWVFENGKALTIADTTTDTMHFKGADQASGFITRSLIAAPIIYQGEILGVFEVTNKVGGAKFNEEDRRLLEVLAAQAAIAIQNTHLVNKVQQTEEAMTELNQIKRDFIGVASHELRSPLGLILGHATFLKEVISPELQPQLDVLIRNSFRLKEVIDSIANMDDLQRGMADLHARPVPIRQIIEEVMASFQQEAQRRRISLRYNPCPDDMVFQGDASKISIALSNLVQNALIFSNADGHVLIAVDQIPGYIKISVIDDGIGIPAKDLPHIFERFYQVEAHMSRKHGGMGLGLSVARLMIEMHGGRLWVESVENRGSNFTFILPLASVQPGEDGGPIPS